MKQRIVVRLSKPGYRIEIHSIYESRDYLIVISSIEADTSNTEIASDMRVINVAHKNLQVVDFLTGFSPQETAHYHEFGSDFIPLPQIDDISDLLENTTCIYEARLDGMRGLRSTLLQKNEQPYIPIELPIHEYSTQPIHGLLNIFPVLENDMYTIVLETVCQKRCIHLYKSLNRLIEQGQQYAENNLDLKNQFFMTEDDALSFQGIVDDVDEEFITHAVQFSMPFEDLGATERFLGFITGVIMAAKLHEPKLHGYSHITVGDRSILSCFDELLACPFGNKIIYPEPINIDHFYHRPTPLLRAKPAATFKALLESETLQSLCAQHKNSKLILEHMQQAELFNCSMDDCKTILASVFNACAEAIVTNKLGAARLFQTPMVRMLDDYIKLSFKTLASPAPAMDTVAVPIAHKQGHL